MERIKSLGWYQKGLLIILLAMILVFSVLYPMTISRKGFEYQDTILIPSQENGSTVYSGEIDGKQAVFTVSEDKTVEFRYGEKTYGPYTVRMDASAIPEDHNLSGNMIGLELRCGEKILFRGGVLSQENISLFFNEDGTRSSIDISASASGGVVLDENGNVVDQMEPSAYTILKLMSGPKLTHKGQLQYWFFGVLICAAAAVSMLFADELFYINLYLRVQNADDAEPSDWVIAYRYALWTVLTIAAMVLFMNGLH